ncbi:uncharacterized protein [Onthophagus taurus]|uniref:uncharacterized protein n=1 Tax=Onthophagus taurus TaxID=166361 RepID=UPI0039BE96AA
MFEKGLKENFNAANVNRPNTQNGYKTIVSTTFLNLGVQTLIERYNKMNSNDSNPPERPPRKKGSKRLKILISTYIKNGRLKEIANEENYEKERNLKRFESKVKDDGAAFQLRSAKEEKVSMNQIQPNIVKRRINEYNELESLNRQGIDETALKNHPNFNKFTKYFPIDLETFIGEDKSSNDQNLLGNFVEGGIMYERYKNGRKKNLQKDQTQQEHLELVKFYRNLFSKITQIPFVIAVTYCTLFFVIELVSFFYTFYYN